MGSIIPAVGSMIMGGAQQQMNNGAGPLQAYADPMNIFGGNSAEAMDPVGYGISKALGITDPLTILTNHIPGFQRTGNGTNGSNGNVPTVLPTLGAQFNTPQMPQGSFGIQSGPGIFNQMASMGAGPTYMPQSPMQAKGANGMPNLAGSFNPLGTNPAAMNRPMYSLGSIPRGFANQ